MKTVADLEMKIEEIDEYALLFKKFGCERRKKK